MSVENVLMFRAPEQMREEVHKRAYELGISLSDLLRLAIRHYLTELDAIHEKERKRSNSIQKVGVRIAEEEQD